VDILSLLIVQLMSVVKAQ